MKKRCRWELHNWTKIAKLLAVKSNQRTEGYFVGGTIYHKHGTSNESAVSNYTVQHLISVNTDRNAHFTLTHCSMWNRKTLFHRDYIKGDDIWHASGLNRGGAVRNVWLRHRLQGPAAVGKLLAQVGLIKINAVVWLVWQWWSFPRSCNG